MLLVFQEYSRKSDIKMYHIKMLTTHFDVLLKNNKTGRRNYSLIKALFKT